MSEIYIKFSLGRCWWHVLVLVSNAHQPGVGDEAIELCSDVFKEKFAESFCSWGECSFAVGRALDEVLYFYQYGGDGGSLCPLSL